MIVTQLFEVEALRRVRAIIPNDALVTLPAVHLFDQQSNVIIMDDCGETTRTLKEFMQTGKSTPLLARQIGTALGRFLGDVHAWGKGNASLIEFFEENQQAKTMSAWATYGRLVSTLSGKDDLPALSNPPLHVSESQLDTVRKLASETTLEMTSTKDSVSDLL